MAVLLRSVKTGHLQSDLQTDKWRFVYCRAGHVWKGELTKGEIESSALEVGQDLKQYCETANNVFAKACENFSIDLIDSHDDAIELSWKKITGAAVKYALGTVKLQKFDSSDVNAVLENAADTILTLKNELTQANLRSVELAKDNAKMASRLAKFAEQKVETESQLFTKFVLILNEKKAKIRNLKEELRKNEARKSNFVDEIDIENKTDEKKDKSEKICDLSAAKNNKRKTRQSRKMPQDDSFTGDSKDLLAKIPKRTNRTRAQATVTACTSGQKTPYRENVAESFENEEEKIEYEDTIDAAEMLDGL